MPNDATGVIWRRLKYVLSPQLDIYKHIAPKAKNLRVLEVGFGLGAGTVQLAKYAYEVVAIEIDRESVWFASEVFPLKNVSWEWGDITRPVSRKFDAIVCLEVLEHVPEWGLALANIKNCLDDYGTLYISNPNANANLRKNDKHEREWTATEFKRALETYFTQVSLMDYTLTEPQGDDTHLTPLIAICTNAKTE